MARRQMYARRSPSALNILFHVLLVFLTGGLWLVWLAVRFLRNNS